MSEEQPPDDPGNVKPTPVKDTSTKDRSPLPTLRVVCTPADAVPPIKTNEGRVQIDQIRRERVPSSKRRPPFRKFSHLKLSDCSKIAHVTTMRKINATFG